MGLHIVHDFETVGVDVTCDVALSYGAVLIDTDTGEIKDSMYAVRRLDNVVYLAEPGTLQWWMKQSDAARAVFNDSGALNDEAFIAKLATFMECYVGRVDGVWGFGADFDNVLFNRLMDSEKAAPAKIPYKKSRCLRTLAAVRPNVERPPFDGVPHNALDDAINEALWLRALLA